LPTANDSTRRIAATRSAPAAQRLPRFAILQNAVMPTPIAPQLDLFEHSRDTMLRNDVLDALLRRDVVAATAARSALVEFDPHHPALAALATLVEALGHAADTSPLSGHVDAAQARGQLQQVVLPAACAQFGAAPAVGWLAPLWRRLAERAAALPYLPTVPEDHAAALWLRVGDAASARAAEEAVASIASWRRIPVPLAWMARARHRVDGLDTVWPLLAELAWLAAPRLALTAGEINDPLLTRLLRRFDDDVDAGAQTDVHPLAWFPAWLLIDQPALLPLLRGANSGQHSAPEQVFRLLVELLGLERQGRHHALIASRKRLRDQQPALYAVYMQSR
jgi:hypothetical protein